MERSRVAWNIGKTKSVVLAKLKEFTIEQDCDSWVVKGFFNKENFFTFGRFQTKDGAEKYLETIHSMF